MHGSCSKPVAGVVLIVSLLAAALASTRPAGAAAGSTSLPNGFGAMVIDQPHGHLFVSGGATNVVSVLNMQGALVTTITGEPGAGGLLLDGNTLYVTTTVGIDAIDTVTLTRTTTYGAGTLHGSSTLAKAGGRIWTTTDDCSSTWAQLVSIVPSTGALTVHSGIGDVPGCLELVPSPASQNLLLGFDDSSLMKISVTPWWPVVALRRTVPGVYGIAQVSFAADGATFLVAARNPYEVARYRTSDLLPDGVSYDGGAFPDAVTSTPQRGGLVAIGRDATSGPDIDVYRRGDPTQHLLQTDLGPDTTLITRGLLFSPDGTRLFAATYDSRTSKFALRVVPVPTTPIPGDVKTSFGSIAVDGARDRVYVSAPLAHAVRVFDGAGTYLSTITGEAGADSLLVDGGTLYVAARGAGVIDAIDTATLTRTQRLGYGSVVKPWALVKAGGRLWTTSGDCQTDKGLVSIDPATGATATFSWPSVGLAGPTCPGLTTSPNDPNLVLAYTTGSAATIMRLDVSSGTPVVVTTAPASEPALSDLRDVAFAPGGATFYAATFQKVVEYDTATLAPTGATFPTSAYRAALATTAAAGGLLATGGPASATPPVNVFRVPGPPGAALLQPVLAPGESIPAEGVAFAADGHALFTVTTDAAGTVRLRTTPLSFATSMQLSSSANPSVIGQPVVITATVVLAVGGHATGGTVTLRDGVTVVGSAAVGTDGTASFAPALAEGSHAFTASFAGAAYQPSTASLTQTTKRPDTTTTIVSSKNPARVGTVVTFYATVTVTPPGAGELTGYIAFVDANSSVAAVRPIVNGKAQFATASLTVGSHQITAEYTANGNFNYSRSDVLTQTITP